jgi:stage II sporulation protein P
MYVVSTAVPTYQNNLKFVKALNKTASSEFAGFTGAVLERGYAYNQGLSDKYLLLEIGNNRNQIEDARNTAKVYGKILAEALKAGN